MNARRLTVTTTSPQNNCSRQCNREQHRGWDAEQGGGS